MIFELPLTEEKVKPHQVTALHLLVALTLTGAGALMYLFYPPSKIWSIVLVIAGLCLLYAGLFRNKWLVKTANSKPLRIAEVVVMLALTVFAAWQKWTPPAIMFGILAAAVLFAIFWEGGRGSLIVLIDDSGIRLPVNARRRSISWPEVEQVLLKFGTLTINCHDNRLYQWTIGSINFDKAAFESYCSKQVDEHRSKRDKNDW
jgi:hypothetical protein